MLVGVSQPAELLFQIYLMRIRVSVETKEVNFRCGAVTVRIVPSLEG